VSSQQNRLEIRVQTHHFEATGIMVPVATILIDGEDLFYRSHSNGFVGFDPDEILGPDQPLLPVEPARRVAVYQCSCGEPGCGVVAPIISGTDAEIRWSDFRDFTGEFDGPIPDEEPEEGSPLPIPEIIFDATQYAREVGRATADRNWETPTRTTARFLKEMLKEQTDALTEWGLEIDWVFPAHRDTASVSVSFRDVGYRYVEKPCSQIVVTLSAKPGAPTDRATEMMETLLSKAPERWMTAFSWDALGNTTRRSEVPPWP
jgi:hypothetical protein